MKTKKIFCANCQEVTDHNLSLGTDELHCTCAICERLVKFPSGNKEELNALIKAHKEANVGQVTQESLDKKLEELAD